MRSATPMPESYPDRRGTRRRPRRRFFLEGSVVVCNPVKPPKSPPPLPLAEFVAAARGSVPADLVLKNARIVNVLTGEIHDGTGGVKGDRSEERRVGKE